MSNKFDEGMETINGEVEVEIELSPSSELALPSENLPTQIYLLPLSERPFFPAQTQPLLMNGKPWMDTVQKIGDTNEHMVGLFMTQPHESDFASPEDYFEIGTVARMHHPMKQEGKIQFIAEGVQRARIVRWLSDTPPYRVEVEYPKPIQPKNKDEAKAFAMAIINILRELIPLNPLYGEELRFFLDRFSPNEPSALTDFAASLTTATSDELQKVLDTLNIRRRMQNVLSLLKNDLKVAKLQTKIRDSVDDKMDEQQRKFFLKEQLKAIQKELGIAKDDRTADYDRFMERMEKLTIPEASMKKIDEEMEKLSMLETGSPEYAVTRNYLDQIISLPWGIHSKDKLDLRIFLSHPFHYRGQKLQIIPMTVRTRPDNPHLVRVVPQNRQVPDLHIEIVR